MDQDTVLTGENIEMLSHRLSKILSDSKNFVSANDCLLIHHFYDIVLFALQMRIFKFVYIIKGGSGGQRSVGGSVVVVIVRGQASKQFTVRVCEDPIHCFSPLSGPTFLI